MISRSHNLFFVVGYLSCLVIAFYFIFFPLPSMQFTCCKSSLIIRKCTIASFHRYNFGMSFDISLFYQLPMLLYAISEFSLLDLYFRHKFEQITTLNLSTKKMKVLFKRYLDFEKKYGDEKKVEGVKRKAMEYVESKARAK